MLGGVERQGSLDDDMFKSQKIDTSINGAGNRDSVTTPGIFGATSLKSGLTDML